MRQRMWRKWNTTPSGLCVLLNRKVNETNEGDSLTAHWEPMRGTVDQAAEYCKKEGEWFEAGVRPLNQREKGERGKQSIEERWALAKGGEFERLPPNT